MTRKEWFRLKAGDVLLFKSGLVRTLIEGPADKPGEDTQNGYVKFPTRRRSWTNRAYTVYLWNDLKHKVVKKLTKTNRLMLKAEWRHLENIGFNPKKEIMREVKEETERLKRLGRPVCPRLIKLATHK
jgi:hypothetical protein